MKLSGKSAESAYMKYAGALERLFPEPEWAIYRPVLEQARVRGIPYVVGGGLAFSAYTGRMRNTKDLDLFVLPADREDMIETVVSAGFVDYFDQKPYDRSWIYRGFREGVVMDIIWSMPNHRLVVDVSWLKYSRAIALHGSCLRIAPPEELLWSKLFVMQRDRCDWPDLMNVLYAAGEELDWDRLLARSPEDMPVFAGLMCVYGWMCPQESRRLPQWIWERLGINRPEEANPVEDGERAPLLDTRDWFGPGEGGPPKC